MHLITHLLISGAVANATTLERRDRTIITLAGVAPDIDALGLVVGLLHWSGQSSLSWFSEYHHVLGHNVGFALLVAVLAAILCRRTLLAPLLSLLAFHLHLLCDLLGSRGPDGYQWPFSYLMPFSDGLQVAWEGQWALNAWPNTAITVAFIAVTLYLAWRKGNSPLEILSPRMNGALVSSLRTRFGAPRVAQ